MSSFNIFLQSSIGVAQNNALNIPIITTFCLYLLGMLAIGLYFMKKSNNLEDYLLGGRSMGSWVTALSTQASDMSGWLLMGLPGAIFAAGTGEAWIGIGLTIGTFFNWLLVAPRLRVYTEQNESLTISTFISKRFGDKYRVAQILSSIIILVFFTIYAASGLVGAGKLFQSMLHIDYKTAVIAGTVVLVLYTLLGGFMAVCWTDLFQGMLMFFALLIVPIMAYNHLGDGSIIAAAEAKNISLNLFKTGTANGSIQTLSFIAIISSMSWGLGYFGMPHVIIRFMSIKSHKHLPKAMTIAMIWVVISLICAIAIGILGMAMYADAPNGDKEQIFIQMIKDLFNPWLGGVLLAAILAAIMSTTDSQLLVCSSSLTEDIYAVVFRKNAKDKELLWISRAGVAVIAITAMIIALGDNKSILSLVSNAWAGFGATFGPVIIMALYSKRTTWYSALSGMVAGGLVLITLLWIWPAMKASGYELPTQLSQWFEVYALLPGFIINLVVVIIVDLIAPQRNGDILKDFSEMLEKLKGTKEESEAK